MDGYCVDESETLAEIVDVQGGTHDGRAEGDIESIVGAKTVIAPVCGGLG